MTTMNDPNAQSRRFSHLLSVIGAIILITFAVTVAGLLAVERRLLTMSGDMLALAAGDIADKLDLILYERSGDIQAMANVSTAAIASGRPPAALQAYLLSMQHSFPLYLWIGVTDERGRVVAETNSRHIGQDQSHKPWFQAVRGGTALHVGDPAPAAEANGAWAISFTAPLMGPNDTFLGTVTSRVGLSVLEDLFPRTLRVFQVDHGVPGKAEWAFLARDGSVLSESLLSSAVPANLLALHVRSASLALDPNARPGYLEETHTRRQIPVMTGYAHTVGYGRFQSPLLGVLVRTARSEILVPIRSEILKLAGMSFLVLAPLAFLGFSLLTRLRRAWLETGEAEREARASKDELVGLNAGLEARVLERTQQMKSTNQALRTEIDVRRKVEEALNRSEKQFRQLTEHSSDLVTVLTPDGHMIYHSPSLETILGYAPAELIGRNVFDLVNPGDLQTAGTVIADAESKPGMVQHLEVRIRAKEGAWHVMDATGKYVADFMGDPAIIVNSRDITDRKRMEDDLNRSREMLRLIINNIPQQVFWKDRESRYLGCNALFAQTVGMLDPSGIIGKDDFDLTSGKTAKLYRADDRSVMETNSPKLNYEEPLVAADGSMRVLRTSKVPLCDPAGQVFGVLGIFEDITERKKLEAHAVRMEHLAAMGQFLTGLAHELKNPLFILTGRLQLLRERLVSPVAAHIEGDLEKAEEAARRMNAVTERLLWFARPHRPPNQRCAVNAILDQSLQSVSDEVMTQHIQVVTAFAPDLPDVWAEPRELNEVFMILIVNAIEAMASSRRGGTLTATTRANDGTGIEVSIQDDGPGIRPEHQARLFEPFFSTKPAGQGTGLGLWTVRTILTALKGAVRVETEVGRVTTFTLTLPAADAALRSNPDEPSSLVEAGA